MKNILFFEPTKTLKTLFEKNIKQDDVKLFFESDVLDFLKAISSFSPDLILINTSFEQPSGFSFARIIREVKELTKVQVRLYSVKPTVFDEQKTYASKADEIIYLYKNTFTDDVRKLVEFTPQTDTSENQQKNQPENNQEKQSEKTVKKDYFANKNIISLYSQAWEKDNLQKIVLTELYKMMQKATDLDIVICDFLKLFANIFKTPAACVCLKDDSEVKLYKLVATDISEKDEIDFIKVCQADFEKNILNSNQVNAKIIAFNDDEKILKELNEYHNKSLPLSAYKATVLNDVSKTKIGTVHVIKDGFFTKEQQELFDFAAKNADTLLTNALLLEKKLFFEKNIRKAFNRFVPEQIIDDLVKEAGENKKLAVGEKREVAILFSDIRSFTNISEVNKPEVIVGFLNRYFTVMVDIIKKYGGTVDKFIGDAIMALFGTPISYEDNANRAVLAAYEMRQALDTIPLGDLVMPEGMKFNIGIGIHYGDVIAGSLGSKDKTDYTVIGDSVNLASRLEGLTKTYGTQVLISESVKNDIIRSGNSFVFRYLDDVKVKGKAVAVPIFAIDRNEREFCSEYKDAYLKGTALYKQGVFNLAKDYFDKCLVFYPEDKASHLMQDRCIEFIKNPPENWDGAISFKTK